MSSALGGLLDRALKSYMSKSCQPNASNSETDKRFVVTQVVL